MATNIETGYRYVGGTILSLERRKQGHRSGSSGRAFYAAILEFGWDSFTWETLCECRDVDLKCREAEYIQLLQPEYNVNRPRPVRVKVVKGRLVQEVLVPPGGIYARGFK